jgi:hypothetical protein
MCVCVGGGVRERVCVGVWEYVRSCVCVCVCVSKKERASMCVCVCDHEFNLLPKVITNSFLSIHRWEKPRILRFWLRRLLHL